VKLDKLFNKVWIVDDVISLKLGKLFPYGSNFEYAGSSDREYIMILKPIIHQWGKVSWSHDSLNAAPRVTS
jgi:hypothetical protein